MKRAVRRFLSIFLLATAGILLVLLVVGLTLVFDWPWWVGVCLLLLLTGMVLGGVFLRKIWLKRREENFVSDIAEQDAARMRNMTVQEKKELKDLQDRWKVAIERLRKSHLKKFGNPLYVLPWYMVLGDSGSGKTTSLNSARLASPFADFGRVQGISGTKQCEWYFFEQAIVIDTAGRYAIPVNGSQDKDEWQKFLSLLLRYRRKEPLNGLIVTVAADRLLDAPSYELEKNGLEIRRRIDELMRAFGIRFPVYTLVTKCDLVNGVNRFCEILPEKSLKQPMGFINQDLTDDIESFMERSITAIDERLRNLRLHLLHEPRADEIDPALLLFPEEFERLKNGLDVFISNVFRKNPYQETPLLRGLFFSSGRQEGTPHSRFSETVCASAEETLPGTNRGLFLHDFFASILPKDRSLGAPTRRALEWRSLTGNLGLTSWIVFGVAVCGLLTFSFVKNMKTIRDISSEFSNPAVSKGEMISRSSSFATMNRLRLEIAKVEERNRHWWIPRFGLNESLEIERELKSRYCRQFREFLLHSFDAQMAENIKAMSAATTDEVYGQYVMHVVRRINILRTRIEHSDISKLGAKPQPFYVSLENSLDQGDSEEKKTFGSLYLFYLVWQGDSDGVAKELEALQSLLRQLIAVKGGDLRWMVAWVNDQGAVPAITLKEFWGGSIDADHEVSVLPSFSRKGSNAIDALFTELQNAEPDSDRLTKHREVFFRWYQAETIASWRNFAAGFSRGAERLRGAGEWRTAALKMADDKGPYFALLNRIALELEPLATKGVPPWLQQVYRYQATRAGDMVGKAAALTKVSGRGGRIVAALKKNIGSDVQENPQIAAGKNLQEYRKALTAIIPATESRPLAFQLAAQTFNEDGGGGGSHFRSASSAFLKLKGDFGADTSDDVFWQLLQGPFEFLWTFIRRESACQLQNLWEDQVLAPTLGMPSQQAIPVMLGPDGLVWRFAKGPAAPFLKGSRYGYGAKEVLGGTLPLNSSLFAFLRKGGQTQAVVMEMGSARNYTIGIRGLPTGANVEASFKPHATRLELQCGGNGQTLVNNNYPVSKTFSWSPGLCSDVVLQIEVGDVVLTRHYLGKDGFPNFLKDMRGGHRTFLVREFPGEKDALQKMGVKYITVNYRFVGSGQVLRQTATLSASAPRSIAQCWAQ